MKSNSKAQRHIVAVQHVRSVMRHITQRVALIPLLLSALLLGMSPVMAEENNNQHVERSQRIAQELTRSYVAKYDLMRRGRTHGEAGRELIRTEQNSWRFRTYTEGRILFLSDRRYNDTEFFLQQGRVAPLNFEYKREGTGSNHYYYVQFDRDNHQLLSENGDPVTATFSEDLLDPNAVLHQLQLDVAGTADRWTYDLIDDDGELTTYEFARGEPETIQVPYGSVETVRVTRVRDNDRRQTYFWFAPRLNFTMVKMQQIEKGKEQAAVVLKSLEFPELDD